MIDCTQTVMELAAEDGNASCGLTGCDVWVRVGDLRPSDVTMSPALARSFAGGILAAAERAERYAAAVDVWVRVGDLRPSDVTMSPALARSFAGGILAAAERAERYAAAVAT